MDKTHTTAIRINVLIISAVSRIAGLTGSVTISSGALACFLLSLRLFFLGFLCLFLYFLAFLLLFLQCFLFSSSFLFSLPFFSFLSVLFDFLFSHSSSSAKPSFIISKKSCTRSGSIFIYLFLFFIFLDVVDSMTLGVLIMMEWSCESDGYLFIFICHFLFAHVKCFLGTC